MRRVLVIGCGVVCAGALAGCGGSHHTDVGPGTPAAGLSSQGAQSTLDEWRSHVGHGMLSPKQEPALRRDVGTAVRPTRAAIVSESVFGGQDGAALYLQLASSHPVWTLRHSGALVRLAAGGRFPGGWAIRLSNDRHATVWISGHAGNEGFVGSATPAIDSASPVQHG